jgi:hypothetical protein
MSWLLSTLFRPDNARSLSEVPRRDSARVMGQGQAGTFDKVVRSEPLARAPRKPQLWVLNGDDSAWVDRITTGALSRGLDVWLNRLRITK